VNSCRISIKNPNKNKEKEIIKILLTKIKERKIEEKR
jgi:hypothetical protein